MTYSLDNYHAAPLEFELYLHHVDDNANSCYNHHCVSIDVKVLMNDAKQCEIYKHPSHNPNDGNAEQCT